MSSSRNERIKEERIKLARKVGERIVGLRNRENLTRDDLADRLGIYTTTLRRYEVEGRLIPPDIGKLVVKYFNMSLDKLYF